MKTCLRNIPALLLLALLLTGCSDPETPQEVTQAFWAAVLEGDAKKAAELSTLVDQNGFDAYALEWDGAKVSWGRVTVDGQAASIDTVFSDLPQMKGEELETTTHLVRINDQWQVDYHRTGDDIATDVRVGGLMGSVRDLGDKLRSRLADESERASQELDRLAAELSAYSEKTRKEISALIEQYGDNLRQRMDQLSRSLDEALEQNPSATEEERDTLEQAQEDLQRQQQALDEDEPDSIAAVSKELSRIQQQLSELSGQSFEHLREQLQRWSRELNRELEQLNQEARIKEQHSI
jgi:gas vesicle protein